MFWVIFDTSTRRDYYRDVHNLLALPVGSTIRYDYGHYHISARAIEEAGHTRTKKVFIAYVQDRNFTKGGADPVGAIEYQRGLWIGTRIANLAHLQRQGNRYYFDLEVEGYPTNDIPALQRVLEPLELAGDVPFAKWVALSEHDVDFESLQTGEHSDNWAATINRIGVFPSQFAGDSFWRVANVSRGPDRTTVIPTLQDHVENREGQPVTTGVEAVYPVFELERLAIQIESRMPETSTELGGEEPVVARNVSLATSSDGPLKGFDGRSLVIRRYAREWIEAEVGGSDRIDVQDCELKLTTGPDVGAKGFPIGPELRFRFSVSKKPGRAYFGLLLAIVAVIAGLGGNELLKSHWEWGIFAISLGIIYGLAAVLI